MMSPLDRYCVVEKHRFLREGIGINSGIKLSDADFAAILLGYFGWGGRIRTFTVLINSEVSYQLDHAPAGL